MAIPVFRAGSAANIVHMGASFTTDLAWASGATLRTPFVAVHRRRLQANIDRIAALARRHGLTVRPHAKTHKCPEIARLQIEVPCVSVGSTPTVCLARNFAGVDEIRPDNYVFFDRTAMRLGAATEEEIALAVFTTLVSGNDTYCIVDAGSKSLSSDLGPQGMGEMAAIKVAMTIIDGSVVHDASASLAMGAQNGE